MKSEKCPQDSYAPTGTIVQKGGARATVTYVLDDGGEDTARYAVGKLAEYRNLTFSFALPGYVLGTLHTEEKDGKTVYVRDDKGNYVYTPREDNVAFWKSCIATGRAEVINHTYSHAFWGTDDRGGTYPYVSTFTGKLLYATVPEGSVTKEIYATQQIITEQFPEQKKACAMSLAHAGIGANTSEKEVDGVIIPSYAPYYRALVSEGIRQGKILGQRGGAAKVILPSALRTAEDRYAIGAYMALRHNSGEGISNWTHAVDEALAMGGWVCFCIHKITPEESTPHYILASQAEGLFSYTDREDIWVATFTDALLYYREWSSASLSLALCDGGISVCITDEEDDDIFTMPLTVRVNLPKSWDTACVGEKALTVRRDEDGTKFVYVDIVPGTGDVVICK